MAVADDACLFTFPEDMYQRVDQTEARIQANAYVLKAAKTSRDLYPFSVIWNDDLLPDDLAAYPGIKRHRHADDPRYDYEARRCTEFLCHVTELGLPVLFKEEFENTCTS